MDEIETGVTPEVIFDAKRRASRMNAERTKTRLERAEEMLDEDDHELVEMIMERISANIKTY